MSSSFTLSIISAVRTYFLGVSYSREVSSFESTNVGWLSMFAIRALSWAMVVWNAAWSNLGCMILSHMSWNIVSMSLFDPPQLMTLLDEDMLGFTLMVFPVSILSSSVAEKSATPLIMV